MKVLVAAALVACASLSACGGGRYAVGVWDTTATCEMVELRPYVDPAQLSVLAAPGMRSHWAQPWRSSSATRPGSAMRTAAGVGIWTEDATATTLPQLASAGIVRVNLPTEWTHMRIDDPTQLGGYAVNLRKALTEIAARGMRPKLQLDAIEGLPAPAENESVVLTEPAMVGARRLRVRTSDVGRIAAGRTLFRTARDAPPSMLITAANADGTLELARPLTADLPAAPLTLLRLRYAPFAHPLRADGSPNPAFEESLAGWLAYAAAIAAEGRAALGRDEFDVDVGRGWSPFYDVDSYYDPPVEPTRLPRDEIARVLLARTIAHLRAQGFTATIANGFSLDWSVSPASSPPGTDLFGRPGVARSASFGAEPGGVTAAVDALGAANGTATPDGRWVEAFTPSYRAFFPEVTLTPALAEAQVFWRAPPEAGELWITSARLDVPWTAPLGQAATGEQVEQVRAKSVLRLLSAHVGMGARGVLLFSPLGSPLTLVDPATGDGGLALPALRRFLDGFAGRDPATIVPITLAAVSGCADARQFAGDGTAAHPDLRDVDVVAFFPFQTAESRWVAAAYVMSRDLLKQQPIRPFSLELTGIDGRTVDVLATDPMDGASIPVEVTARRADGLTMRLPLGDSPRLIELVAR